MTEGVEAGSQDPDGPAPGDDATGTVRRRIVPLLIGALQGAALVPVVWLVVHYGVSPRLPALSPDGGDILLGLVALMVLFVCSIFVHEFGHAVGGRLARFRLVIFGVWPLVLVRRTDGPWHLRVHPGLGLGMGMALSVPRDTADLRRRLIWVIGGGPAASLAAAVASLVAFVLLTPEPAASSPTALALALLSLAGLGMSLVTVYVSLLPLGDTTDGERLAVLRAGGDAAEAEVGISLLQGQAMSGVRPRCWNPTWLQAALQAPPETTTGALARQKAFESAVDGEDPGRARAILEKLRPSDLEAVAGVYRDLCFQGAWFACVYDEDADVARRWMALGMSLGSAATFERAMAEAALLSLEGDLAGAEARLDAATASLGRLERGFGRHELSHGRIDHLQARIQGEGPEDRAFTSR